VHVASCAVQLGAFEPKTRVRPPRNVWSNVIVSASVLPKIRVPLQSRPGLISAAQPVLAVPVSGPGVIVPWRCMTEPKPMSGSSEEPWKSP